jgi:16S rRNA C967 or C1407 C5-methylase (RsmB/RsmF family)
MIWMQEFRNYHLFNILEDAEEQGLPLDRYLSDYFREHKALGSKDRAYIAETIYGMVRWKGLLDHLSQKPVSWERRQEIYSNIDPLKYQHDESIPQHVRVSFPEPLFNLFVSSHGLEKAQELCLICNTPAPTTVRANILKTTREALLEAWSKDYQVAPCKVSPVGITFLKKINLFALPEFKQGFFEVQDEGSQLLAGLMKVAPGDLVMDYCSGSGGKSLAFAPRMEGTGQIYLHDIRPFALQEARNRLKRAGIQNAQTILNDSQHLKKLKKKMDWVLADVPCSGTGTLRRNPDMKWKFEEAALERLVGQQRNIFEKALSYMKPEGRIVYATCSILQQENQQQIDHFLKTYDLEVDGEVFRSLPTYGGMDGFFGAVLKRNDAL